MRWWQIRRRDADLERELRSDLELEEEEQREKGLSEDETRYAARRALGHPTRPRAQAPRVCGGVPIWGEALWRIRDSPPRRFLCWGGGSGRVWGSSPLWTRL